MEAREASEHTIYCMYSPELNDSGLLLCPKEAPEMDTHVIVCINECVKH